MNFQERLELLSSDRIRRIAQRAGFNPSGRPPEEFINSVVNCAQVWAQKRAERHRPNGLIYHYCDANALLNILKTRKAWATSTKYLNDKTELLTFSTSMRSHANKYRATAAGEALSDMVDFYWSASDTHQTQTFGMDRYACCFSADGDLLSQWRAYGNNGRGYAIGFDPQDIGALEDVQSPMTLRRLTYSGENEAELIDELFSRFMPVIADYVPILDSAGWNGVPARNWLSMRFGECLLELVEEVKDRGFSEEREWRIYGNKQETQFRVSNDRVVPYRQLDLSSKKRPNLLPIIEIVIGPRLDVGEATMSLSTFSSSLGYGLAMNFRKSQVPYR